MMLNLLNRKSVELAGVDIGSSAVKLVHLNKTSDGYTLVSAAAEPIAPCAAENEKQQRQNCLNAIRTCLQRADFKNKSVVCGVSGPEVIVRGFTFPPLPDAAVEQAVRMEAQQVCPLDINQSALDFQLINTVVAEKDAKSGKPRPRRGVMAVGTERIIEAQTALLAEAGAKAMMIDVNALALLNCLNELSIIHPQETVAVIDVGFGLSNIVIYGRDGLPFVRDINLAGKDIVQHISHDLNLSENEVNQLFTLEKSTEDINDQFLLALNNAIAPLANAVNETLRFYSFQEQHAGVDRIFLCGGFALIKPFVEFLTDALSVPVELFNPFTHICCEGSSNEKQALMENGPVYAIATGLAMRTV